MEVQLRRIITYRMRFFATYNAFDILVRLLGGVRCNWIYALITSSRIPFSLDHTNSNIFLIPFYKDILDYLVIWWWYERNAHSPLQA